DREDFEHELDLRIALVGVSPLGDEVEEFRGSLGDELPGLAELRLGDDIGRGSRFELGAPEPQREGARAAFEGVHASRALPKRSVPERDLPGPLEGRRERAREARGAGVRFVVLVLSREPDEVLESGLEVVWVALGVLDWVGDR